MFAIDKARDVEVLQEVKNFRDGKCLNEKVSKNDPAGDKRKNCPADRKERDIIIYDLKMIIDRNYEDYARAFEQTQDTAGFLGETSAASLTAVATLVGASPTKDILTTASTLVQSTRLARRRTTTKSKPVTRFSM